MAIRKDWEFEAKAEDTKLKARIAALEAENAGLVSDKEALERFDELLALQERTAKEIAELEAENARLREEQDIEKELLKKTAYSLEALIEQNAEFHDRWDKIKTGELYSSLEQSLAQAVGLIDKATTSNVGEECSSRPCPFCHAQLGEKYAGHYNDCIGVAFLKQQEK